MVRSMRAFLDRGRGWWPIAVVVALLVALAALQYRWIGEVSRLERLRLEETIGEGMLRFADDLDREVGRLADSFAGAGLGGLGEAWERWQDESPHAELLAEILVWSLEADALGRWDPATGALRPTSWPQELRAALLHTRLSRSTGDRRAMAPGTPFLAVSWPPALVLPATTPPGEALPRSHRRRRDRDPGRALVLLLDERQLRERLLPALADAHFGGAASLPVEVTVLAAGPRRLQALYSTLESPRLAPTGGSLRLPLLQSRRVPELRPEPRRRRVPATSGSFRPVAGDHFLRARDPRTIRDGWLLVVEPKAGSLDAAVARLRWRNLAISAAILGLLGISLGLVLSAARRQQELARRQLALVAGITHELHTPLAALGAAAQNLEDGVVRDPERIREYGRLVRREGGRLQKLVDQTLALAGMRSGQQALSIEPVDLATAIERAIADSVHGSSGIAVATRIETTIGTTNETTIETTVEPGAVARADPEALQRILVNLLANARKYGGGRVWIGAHTSRGRGGESDRVEVSVVDDGPGVAPVDRAHLFAPFHRGQRARDVTSPGSGLGLYLSQRLAEAMGGSLALVEAARTAAPRELRGAAFRLLLPATPPATLPAPTTRDRDRS